MEAVRTKDGLYTFGITLQFKNHEKKLTGLVDTGSNICVCTYKIPVALRARPTSFGPISSPIARSVNALGYSINLRFDDKSKMIHVYRLPLKMNDIDFILGMSVLQYCKVALDGDKMAITWLEESK